MFFLYPRRIHLQLLIDAGLRAISSNDFRGGTNIVLDGAPWRVQGMTLAPLSFLSKISLYHVSFVLWKCCLSRANHFMARCIPNMINFCCNLNQHNHGCV
jgi:hypothetical protein